METKKENKFLTITGIVFSCGICTALLGFLFCSVYLLFILLTENLENISRFFQLGFYLISSIFTPFYYYFADNMYIMLSITWFFFFWTTCIHYSLLKEGFKSRIFMPTLCVSTFFIGFIFLILASFVTNGLLSAFFIILTVLIIMTSIGFIIEIMEKPDVLEENPSSSEPVQLKLFDK